MRSRNAQYEPSDEWRVRLKKPRKGPDSLITELIYPLFMDSNRLLSIVAITVSVVALIFCCYSIISQGPDQSGHFTEGEVQDYIQQIDAKGGSIYINGTNYGSEAHTFKIVDHKIVIHHFKFSANAGDIIAPLSEIDRIFVKE